MNTISFLLKQYTEQFRNAGFESPDIEGAYILSEVSGIRHSALIAYPQKPLAPEQIQQADTFVRRRLAGEPWQYLFGWAEFRFLTLEVGPGCLIPRPETEVLVDHVLQAVPQNGSLCELGTGSGAVALAAASERPDIRVWASELSPAAFQYAERNLQKLGLANVTLAVGDLFGPFSGLTFDCIAANLPYIPEGEKENLPVNVRDWEPAEALFSGTDGLDVIRRAVLTAPAYLKSGGMLLFETGEEQGVMLQEFVKKISGWSSSRILKDQYGANRFWEAVRT